MLTRVLTRLPCNFGSSMVTVGRNNAVEKLVEGQGIQLSPRDITAIAEVVAQQQKHLGSAINDLKSDLNRTIALNFEQQHNNETTVLTTEPGNNTWKLAELITLGASAKLVSLLLGFPSYGALVATLGIAGTGALLSYSNYLKRTASQITSISWTNTNQLHIHYLKPSSIFSSDAHDFIVDRSEFRYVSFDCKWKNLLRKCNHTAWVQVGDQLYWYNAGEELTVNSHLYHKLL